MFKPELKSQLGEDVSILIKLDNHSRYYIGECGEAKDLSVKEIQNTEAIFISHTHIDHFVNFDSIIRHQIGIQRRIVICGPQNIAKQVQARLKSYTWNLIEKGSIVYEIRELISDNEIKVFEIEPPIWELIELGHQKINTIFKSKTFRVEAVLLDHKTPSMAYKFIEDDSIKIDLSKSDFKGGKWVNDLKNAFISQDLEKMICINSVEYPAKEWFHLLEIRKGDTLGVIMDHAASDSNKNKIEQLFKDCKTVFIESFYKEAERDLADKNFHSYSRASGKIMKKIGVQNPIPVHFSRKYNSREITELKNEFFRAFNKENL